MVSFAEASENKFDLKSDYDDSNSIVEAHLK